MRVLVFVCSSLLLHFVLGFPDFLNYVPNAQNVLVDGVRVVGLGHPTATARSTSFNNANQFGKDVFNAERNSNSRDPQVIWTAVCNLDADGDGILNKDELCDPGCNNPGANPACQNGQVLTHPAGDDIGVGNDIAPKLHGWLMIVAWGLCAPYGILRAVFFKKGKRKDWFFDHKLALTSCVVLNLLAFAVMIIEFGFDPLSAGFENFGDSDSATHVVVGIVVILIAIMQPVSGLLRPHLPQPGEAKTMNRVLWEYQHRFTGRIGIILAFWAIFLGLPLVYDDQGQAFGIVLILILVFVGLGSTVYVLVFRDSISATPPAETAIKVNEKQTTAKRVEDNI